jgi:hypothetical protein
VTGLPTLVLTGGGPAASSRAASRSRTFDWYSSIRLVTGTGQNDSSDGTAPGIRADEARAVSGGRSASFFSRQRRTISRSRGGSAVRSGASWTTRYSTLAAFPSPNGGAPPAAYAITQPSPKTSAAGPVAVPTACSGDM